MDWGKDPSSKCTVLIDIICHHLANDNANPLKMDRSGGELVPWDPGNPQDQLNFNIITSQQRNLSPDKIIVYSAFMSNNPLIKAVLRLHSIEVYKIIGDQKVTERSWNLKVFKIADAAGPRVLLLSSVGAVGLNILEANILM